MSKTCKKRVHGNYKKNLPWDSKKCAGSYYQSLTVYDFLKFIDIIVTTNSLHSTIIHIKQCCYTGTFTNTKYHTTFTAYYVLDIWKQI